MYILWYPTNGYSFYLDKVFLLCCAYIATTYVCLYSIVSMFCLFKLVKILNLGIVIIYMYLCILNALWQMLCFNIVLLGQYFFLRVVSMGRHSQNIQPDGGGKSKGRNSIFSTDLSFNVTYTMYSWILHGKCIIL